MDEGRWSGTATYRYLFRQISGLSAYYQESPDRACTKNPQKWESFCGIQTSE